MSSLVAVARRSSSALLLSLLVLGGCSKRSPAMPPPVLPDASTFDDMTLDLDTTPDAIVDAHREPVDMPFDPDMACTSASAAAVLERLPADIIWVVDNSSSMTEEIENVKAGINAFADFIDATGIDYRVIMLSKRGTGVFSTSRYAICVPPPLAGDAACGNGPRFFHSSIDILSTQPLEQILGTLGQSTGYGPTDSRGGEPWRDWLRPEASKTFVVVTDDNARLSATNFEHFRGPPPATEWHNPATTSPSLYLPPGLLEPEWGGLFDGYKMSAIYGYTCATASPGATYTDLVTSTGGVRADICAPPSTWGTFFESIATEVVRATRIACDLAVPMPPDGLMFSPGRVNVEIQTSGGATPLRKTVGGVAGCAATPQGWYYDDDLAPTRLFLCPAACDLAQGTPGTSDTSVQIQFGCETIFG